MLGRDESEAGIVLRIRMCVAIQLRSSCVLAVRFTSATRKVAEPKNVRNLQTSRSSKPLRKLGVKCSADATMS